MLSNDKLGLSLRLPTGCDYVFKYPAFKLIFKHIQYYSKVGNTEEKPQLCSLIRVLVLEEHCWCWKVVQNSGTRHINTSNNEFSL